MIEPRHARRFLACLLHVSEVDVLSRADEKLDLEVCSSARRGLGAPPRRGAALALGFAARFLSRLVCVACGVALTRGQKARL